MASPRRRPKQPPLGERIKSRSLEELAEQGRKEGAAAAHVVDEDYGATRPSAVRTIEAMGGAEALEVTARCARGFAPLMDELQRCAAVLERDEAECKAAEDAAQKAEAQAKKEAERLPDKDRHHRYGTALDRLRRWSTLILLAAGDIGLTRLAIELLSIDWASAWLISITLGAVQLLTFYWLGQLSVRWRAPAADRPARRGALALFFLGLSLSLPALAMALTMGLVRADYLEFARARVLGLPIEGTGVGFALAAAFLVAVQLSMDVVAFLEGRLYGDGNVRAVDKAGADARAAARRRRAALRRKARDRARFGAACAAALAWCDEAERLVWQAWSQRRTQVYALLDGIGREAGPLVAAALSEDEQVAAVTREAGTWRDEALKQIEANRARAEAVAQQQGFAAPQATPTQGTTPAIAPAGGNHKGDARRVAAGAKTRRGGKR